MAEKSGRGGAVLDDASVRGQGSIENGQAAGGLQRAVHGMDDFRIVVARPLEVFAQAQAGDRGLVQIQQGRHLTQERRGPSRVGEVLHQEAAGRLQIQQHRRGLGQFVEPLEGQRDAGPPGHREEMNDGVGGTADGMKGADGVVERSGAQQPRRFQVQFHQAHDLASGPVRQARSAGIGRRVGGVPGQCHSQGFGQRGQGGGRAHGHAVARTPDHGALEIQPVFLADPPGSKFGLEAPAIGAGSQLLASPVGGELWPAGHENRRHVRTHGAHEQSRRGLVATSQEDHPIQRIGPDAFLHVHAQEVPEEHGGGAHVELAQRDDRKFEGHPAGLPDPLLDPLGQRAQVGIAMGQLAPGVADADEGTVPVHRGVESESLQGRLSSPPVQLGGVEPLAAAQVPPFPVLQPLRLLPGKFPKCCVIMPETPTQFGEGLVGRNTPEGRSCGGFYYCSIRVPQLR